MKIAILTSHTRLISESWIKNLSAIGSVSQVSPDASKADIAYALETSDIAVTGWGSPMLPPPVKTWKLRYICHITGELKRNIPVSYWEAGIPVTNWGDSFSFATAEGSVALIFGVLKGLPALDKNLREQGHEGEGPRPFCTLYKTRVGIYGLSAIGRLVAEYLRPFRPILSFYDPTVTKAPDYLIRYDSLDTLFASNDLITIHAGLNDVTRDSINYRLLSMLPHGGAVINTARGHIVVENDLARILNEGRIKAGIDVICDERDWRTSPLSKCPNTVFTGHALSIIGPHEMLTLQETALENIRCFVENKPLRHIVSAERFRMMT